MRAADIPANNQTHHASRRLVRRHGKSDRAPRQAGGRRALTVVKIGGSLAFAPELRGWLDAVARARGSVVVVPGGGPFADAVRAAQARMGFDESAAHAMAMMAMAQFGRALLSFETTLERVETRAAIRRALGADRVPVWDPERMAAAAGLPETWRLTSDSLAAWLTGALRAERLLLVKHGRFDGLRLDAGSLATEGVVDPLFPHYLSASGARAFLARPEQAQQFDTELLASAFPEIVTEVEPSSRTRAERVRMSGRSPYESGKGVKSP
jgi:dihydroneopterin aldolase